MKGGVICNSHIVGDFAVLTYLLCGGGTLAVFVSTAAGSSASSAEVPMVFLMVFLLLSPAFQRVPGDVTTQLPVTFYTTGNIREDNAMPPPQK